MNGPRILIVDDEPDFLRLIKDVLTEEKFQVFTARDGLQALKSARESHPDLILLDWNLPGKNGLDVCRDLKADPATRDIPILMLTARERETDNILGLEMGADDYILKSALHPRVLAARVRAALRFKSSPGTEGTVVWQNWVLDFSRREFRLAGTKVELRQKEFDLLAVFLRNPGRVLSRQHLTEIVWGVEYMDSTNTLYTTITRLRSKLGPHAQRIQAVKNLGYRFEDGKSF